jgi:hypothetical protein
MAAAYLMTRMYKGTEKWRSGNFIEEIVLYWFYTFFYINVVLPLCYKRKRVDSFLFKEETQPHTFSIFSQMPKEFKLPKSEPIKTKSTWYKGKWLTAGLV